MMQYKCSVKKGDLRIQSGSKGIFLDHWLAYCKPLSLICQQGTDIYRNWVFYINVDIDTTILKIEKMEMEWNKIMIAFLYF